MELTFLTATNNTPLTKEFKKDGTVQPYPLVKKLTSVQELVTLDNTGLRKAALLIKDYGNQGYCLQKGPLKEALINESRKNKVDKIRPSEYIVLDVDDIQLPSFPLLGKISQQHLTDIAEEIIQHLPAKIFHNSSYLVQASSSLGLKKPKLSLHLFFFLQTPLPPASIKLWVKHINLITDLFNGQLKLSENGMALSYRLDPSVTDNSHLIFIAPPRFEDISTDPFNTSKDRLALIIKTSPTIELQEAVAKLTPENINQITKKKLGELREKSGLAKKKYKLLTVSINNEIVEVISNPDHLLINIVDDTNYPYIRCNVNHGDSRGYYFDARNPLYMHNFKGEPVWEIAKANAGFIAQVGDLAESHGDMLLEPIVLRDFDTDVFFNGLFDRKAGRFSSIYPLTPTSKGSIPDFMLTHGHTAPVFIPDAKIVFDPPKGQEKPNLDIPPLYVNTYAETEYMFNAVAPVTAAVFNNASKSLENFCPLCYRIMSHMLGDSLQDIEHFLNWLAYIYQRKTKTMTAWVLAGTTGTGKGVFVNNILKPLLGHNQVPMRSLENLEEHFNRYMRQALVLVIDEFRIQDAGRGANRSAIRLTDKLKLQITEPTLTIRAMRADQVEIPSYVNFIFLTNHHDAIRIEPNDRRYNIGTRQEVKLDHKYTNIDWIDSIEGELYNLAGWLNSYKLNINAARTCLNNSAKEQMQHASTSLFDEFCTVLREGKIDYFYDVLDMSPIAVIGTSIIRGKQIVLKWLEAIAQGSIKTIIPSENFRILYHLLVVPPVPISPREFNRRLAQQGISIVRKRTGNDAKAIRGIEIDWADITPQQAQDKHATYQTGANDAPMFNQSSPTSPGTDLTSSIRPIFKNG